ncbi:hypothetical protein Tco_0758430 [Tanacetum coccineum]
MLTSPSTMPCLKFLYLTNTNSFILNQLFFSNLSLLFIILMSSSSKFPSDYSRRANVEPWRHSHNLPPSPPSPPPNRTPSTSPITTNSLSSLSPPQNLTHNQIAHEIHLLSNLIKINLQQAIKATNPSPLTLPCILPPTLDQVNFHSRLWHCCLQTQDLFDILRDDLNRIKSIIIGPTTLFPSSITTSLP